MTRQEAMLILDTYKKSVEDAKKVRMTGKFSTQYNIIGPNSIVPILIIGPLGDRDDDVKSKSNDIIVQGCNELKQRGEKVLAVVSLRDIKYRVEKNYNSMNNIPPSSKDNEINAIMSTCSTKEDTIIHFSPYLIKEGKFVWLQPVHKQVEEVEIADLDLSKLFPDGF